MSLINQKVMYRYYVGNNSKEYKEGEGTVVDKVRMADKVLNEQGGVAYALTHDIYLIRNGAGELITMHPANLIKVIV